MRMSLPETVKKGFIESAKKVIESGCYDDIDQVDSDRLGSGLFHCCYRGYFDLACLFIKNGASCNFVNKFGSTPLHVAADNDELDLVRLLLHHGANPNTQNPNGDTPCHLATSRGHQRVVQKLLSWGCDQTIRNNKQKTCRQEAEAHNHWHIVKMMAEYAETGATKILNTESPSTRTPPKTYSESPPDYCGLYASEAPSARHQSHSPQCWACGQRLPPSCPDSRVVRNPPGPAVMTDTRTRKHPREVEVGRGNVRHVEQNACDYYQQGGVVSSRGSAHGSPTRKYRHQFNAQDPRGSTARYFEPDPWEYVYVTPSSRDVNSLLAYRGEPLRDEDGFSELVSK